VPLDKNLVNNGVTNPKTLYIKKDKNDLVVVNDKVSDVIIEKTMIDANTVSAVSASSVEVSKLTKQRDEALKLISQKDSDILQMTKQRDEAIALTLRLKKDIDLNTLDLNKEIQTLKQNYDSKELLMQDKLQAFAVTFASTKELTSDKESEVAKIILEKDALLKQVELLEVGIEKLKKELDSTKDLVSTKIDIIDGLKNERDEAVSFSSDLKKEIQTLKQDYIEKDALTQEKVVLLNKEIERLKKELDERQSLVDNTKDLVAKKIDIINSLKQERDEAISLTLSLKKDIDAQTLDLNNSMQALKHDYSIKEASSQEKLKLLTVDLSKYKELIAKIQSTSKEKIATIVASLAAAKQLIVKDDEQIQVLKEKIAQNEKALDKERSIRQDTETEILKERKNFVIQNIMSVFKLSKVEFKTGSSILTKESTKLLDRVSKIMKKHTEYKYKIQGHTDSSGNENSNLKLSDNRSKSVKDYLISKGVDANILSSVGFGSSKPIADNKTAEGRSVNRRVVFEILD
jgi:outer membrane protein OmpA-like peptidoglycan-associated protein